MEIPTFSRRQRVLYRRSVLCGRAPEFGIIVKRQPESGNLRDWYHVRDEDRAEGGCSEHAEMLSDASAPDWIDREIERLEAEAEMQARRENECLSWRWAAEGTRAAAARLAELRA